MRFFLLFVVSLFFLGGCASKNSQLERELKKEVKLTICNHPVYTLLTEQQNSDVFHRFPFIDKRQFEIKGKFNKKFYEKLTLIYNAKNFKDVDFWKLQEEPYALDFIYIEPMWIKKYRKLTSDLFANIAYSLNISIKEQEILRNWVKNGGILWMEFGLYSTRYDIFNKEGETSTYTTKSSLQNALDNLTFLQKPFYKYLFEAKKVDIINYMPTIKSFIINQNASKIKGIKRLKLVVNNFMEEYVVLDGQRLLVDKNNNPLVTLVHYGKGYIVSLLPFEYTDVYYDGELLRWKLLFYLIKRL